MLKLVPQLLFYAMTIGIACVFLTGAFKNWRALRENYPLSAAAKQELESDIKILLLGALCSLLIAIVPLIFVY